MRRRRLHMAVLMLSLLLIAVPLSAGPREDAAGAVMDSLTYAEKLVRNAPDIPEDEYMALVDARLTSYLNELKDMRSRDDWNSILTELSGMARPMLSSISEIRGRSVLVQAEEERNTFKKPDTSPDFMKDVKEESAPAPQAEPQEKPEKAAPVETPSEAPLKEEPVKEEPEAEKLPIPEEKTEEPEKEIPAPEEEEDPEEDAPVSKRKYSFDIGGMVGLSNGAHFGYVTEKWQAYVEVGYHLSNALTVTTGGDYIFHFGKHSVMTGGAMHIVIGTSAPDHHYSPGYYETETMAMPVLAPRVSYTYEFSDINLIVGGFLGCGFNIVTAAGGPTTFPAMIPDCGLTCCYRW